MAAISRGGLNTLYALQKSAGLQPGNLSPVIERLQECGFLTRSEAAKRKRKVMELTENGEAFLEAQWMDCLNFGRDLESNLRGVVVALFMGNHMIAEDYLQRLASQRERQTVQVAPRSAATGASPVEFYSTMRAVHETRRIAMEAAVLREFEMDVKEVIKNKKKKTESTQNPEA